MSDEHNTHPGTPDEDGPQPPQYRYNQGNNPWQTPDTGQNQGYGQAYYQDQWQNQWREGPQQEPQNQQQFQQQPYQEPQYHQAQYQDPQQAQSGFVADPSMGHQEEQKRGGPNYLVISLVVLALIAVAALGYFILSGTNRDAGESASSSVSAESESKEAENSEKAEAEKREEEEEEERRKEEEEREAEAEERPANPRLPGDAVAVNGSARGSNPGGDLNSVWKSGPTSDDFAVDVRDAYVDAYLDGDDDDFNHVVEVYSSVTGQSYTMNCRDNGQYVHCTGGNNANVYIA